MNSSPGGRTGVELEAIARSLLRTGGCAPEWLSAELSRDEGPVAVLTAPSAGDYRAHMAAALSFGGLLAAFLGCVEFADGVTFAKAHAAARPAAVDTDGLEAIAMVQDWRAAGDDKPVVQRLAGAVSNPWYPRAWSAERTEADSYLVIFREPAGSPVYAFEVSLETEAVQASPEAVERLTMLRVREAAEAQDGLLAHAR